MKKLPYLLLAGVSVLAVAQPAFAQDVKPADSAEAPHDESVIIVNARRRAESLQDVPLNVQAVTGEDLQQLEIRRFEDIARVVPGLTLSTNTGGIATSSSLRGVNFDARASGASTAVELYRNDAVISGAPLFQSLYDIGQIEVLRGPQGTLRGRASPSGSITVTTRRPVLDEVSGYVSGSLTDQSRRAIDGAMNIPVVADVLAVRIAGFVGSNEGGRVTGLNVRTGVSDDNIYDRTEALRASVRADPFDGILVLDFNYETIKRNLRFYDQVESFNQVLSTAGASPVTILARDRLGVGALANTSDQTHRIFNWQAQLTLAGQQLTYVGSDVQSRINVFAPLDVSGYFAVATAASAPNLPFAQDTVARPHQTTHEVRLQNVDRIGGMFDYVIGAMQLESSSPSLFYGNTGIASTTTLLTVVHTGRDRYRSDRERSIFGNLTLHLGDHTEISGGVRQIWFRANSGIRVDVTPGSNRSLDPSTWVDQASVRRCFGISSVAGCLPQKEATIYSASIKHNFTDDLMVYASYGTSWRPGNSVVGFAGTAPSALQLSFLNLADETSKSFEVGFKSSWLDDRLVLNVSAYRQTFINYPFRVATPIVSLGATTPAPVLATAFNFVAPVPAKITGVEGELSFKLNDNFDFGATFAFTDGKIDGASVPCVDLDDNNLQDAVVPTPAALFAHVGANQIDTCLFTGSPGSSARWQGSLSAQYQREFSPNAAGYLRSQVTWQGNSAGDGLNVYDSVKAYGVVNLYLGVRDPDGAWDFSFFANNITNTFRVLTRTDGALSTSLRAGIPIGGGATSINTTNATNYVGITTTQPREFGISLKVAFGSR